MSVCQGIINVLKIQTIIEPYKYGTHARDTQRTQRNLYTTPMNSTLHGLKLAYYPREVIVNDNYTEVKHGVNNKMR